MNYEEFAKSRGLSLSEMGSSGVAFGKAAALEALELLKQSNAVVLGGDVIAVKGETPQFNYDSWHFDPSDAEPASANSAASIQTAVEYINKYPDPGDGSIMYARTIASREGSPQLKWD